MHCAKQQGPCWELVLEAAGTNHDDDYHLTITITSIISVILSELHSELICLLLRQLS